MNPSDKGVTDSEARTVGWSNWKRPRALGKRLAWRNVPSTSKVGIKAGSWREKNGTVLSVPEWNGSHCSKRMEHLTVPSERNAPQRMEWFWTVDEHRFARFP